MPTGFKDAIEVEWVNITYRSVGTKLMAVILLIAGGLGSWFYFSEYKPRATARAAVERASSRVGEASRLTVDERMAETVSTARTALSVARAEFDGRAYDDATVNAIRAENLALKVISSAAGEERDSRLVRFHEIEGDVRVKRAGEFSWRAADARIALQIGDQIKTSSRGSAQLLYFDGTLTTVQPGSLLEIRDLYEDPVTKVRRVRQKLTWGEVRASTRQRNVSGSYHEVSTAKVAARTESAGEFRVAYDKQKKTTTLDVFEGRVRLEGSDTKATVETGQRIRAKADGKLAAKSSLPGVPRLLSPSDQRVFVAENRENQSLTLTWDQVAGAQRYRLMIAEQSLFSSPLYDAERRDTSAVLEGVPPGSYFWRVSAISSKDTLGPFSASRRFRVTDRQIRDANDAVPPRLEITEFVPVGQMVIINGQTEPGATVWVDDSKVEVYDDGSFNAVVRMRREGLNHVVVVAQDNAGNESTEQREAFLEVF